MKKERATTSDEQRERTLIAEQIERAQAEAEGSGSKEPSPPVELGLKRDDPSEKVVLSFAPKTPALASKTDAPSAGLKLNPLKLSVNPLKPGSNPLKRPNVFKQAASSSTPKPAEGEQMGKKRDAPMSNAERLIFEDQQRKRRRMEQEAAVA